MKETSAQVREEVLTAILDEDAKKIAELAGDTPWRWLLKELDGDWDYLDEKSEEGSKLLSPASVFKTAPPYIMASPMEIALRAGKKQALAVMGDLLRQCIFRRNFESLGDGWTSRHLGGWLKTKDREPNFVRKGQSPLHLCLFNEDWETYRALVKMGFPEESVNPNMIDGPYVDFDDDFPAWWSYIDIRATTMPASAREFLQMRGRLYQEMEDLFEAPQATEAWRGELEKLLAQQPRISYLPLARASEIGDVALLKRLFDAGGNPNCRYKTGVPMLARLDAKTRSQPGILQAWLDAGAAVVFGDGEENASFGTDDGPVSVLIEAIWEGETAQVRQMLEKSQGAVPIERLIKGKRYGAPLLTAINRDKLDVARLLVEKGASLAALDEDTGWPIFTSIPKKLFLELQALCTAKEPAHPLMAAIEEGRVAAVRKLATPEAINARLQSPTGGFAMTPLEAALFPLKPASQKVLEAILEAGADANVVGALLQLPLDLVFAAKPPAAKSPTTRKKAIDAIFARLAALVRHGARVDKESRGNLCECAVDAFAGLNERVGALFALGDAEEMTPEAWAIAIENAPFKRYVEHCEPDFSSSARSGMIAKIFLDRWLRYFASDRRSRPAVPDLRQLASLRYCRLDLPDDKGRLAFDKVTKLGWLKNRAACSGQFGANFVNAMRALVDDPAMYRVWQQEPRLFYLYGTAVNSEKGNAIFGRTGVQEEAMAYLQKLRSEGEAQRN
jgi:hypothetical protein